MKWPRLSSHPCSRQMVKRWCLHKAEYLHTWMWALSTTLAVLGELLPGSVCKFYPPLGRLSNYWLLCLFTIAAKSCVTGVAMRSIEMIGVSDFDHSLYLASYHRRWHSKFKSQGEDRSAYRDIRRFLTSWQSVGGVVGHLLRCQLFVCTVWCRLLPYTCTFLFTVKSLLQYAVQSLCSWEGATGQ